MSRYLPPSIPTEAEHFPPVPEPITLAEQIKASSDRIARLTHRWKRFWYHAETPDDVYDAELAYQNLQQEEKILAALLAQVEG